jgi:CheY-like chemotaxis protein
MNAFKKRALLVVDDSHDDVELLKRAFYKTGWTNPIVTLPNGEDAIDYLVSRLEAGKSEWDSLPVAILTDLKMPRGDGFQLLQWIRGQAVLDHVLRVVITNSNIETDVQRAFEAGANFFLTKPADYDDFLMFASKLPRVAETQSLSGGSCSAPQCLLAATGDKSSPAGVAREPVGELHHSIQSELACATVNTEDRSPATHRTVRFEASIHVSQSIFHDGPRG